jgi:serine/threonine protein kinase
MHNVNETILRLNDKIYQVNILICGNRRAQIADFGLVTMGDATTGRMSTRTANTGTTQWMSPERLEGASGRLKASDDVYAYGCLMYTVSGIINRHSSLSIMFRCSLGKCHGMALKRWP